MHRFINLNSSGRIKSIKMVKLIIFDLDGVLVISNNAHIKACRIAMKTAGIKKYITKEELTSHFGESYGVVLKAVMGDEYTPQKLEIAYEQYMELIRSEWFLKNVKRIRNLRKFLLGLRKMNIRLAIASGNERYFIDRIIRFAGIEDLFDLIIAADDVKRSKPDPEMIEKVVKSFGLRLNEILFIGDAKNDILAAKRAGVISAVVLTGVLNKGNAKKLNPDFIFSKITDLTSPLDLVLNT